jgi:hypothetical protein
MPRSLLAALLLCTASTAHAIPFGPTAAVGGVVTPTKEYSDFTLRPMTGPVVQLGFEVGDWFNSQFMVQYTSVNGAVDFKTSRLQGTDHVDTLLGGYELRLDIFGKAGKAGFTPFLGAGFLLGHAHVEVASASNDPAVQAELIRTGAADQSRDGILLELHALIGLRYRIHDGLGVRAELTDSTYGGFFGTLEPKLGIDYSF